MIINKKILGVAFATLAYTGLVAGNCDGYLAEANAVSGVVPKIVNGKLKSLSMYANKSFIAPKGSLINIARRQAEMSAKRDFSSWIKEKVASNTLNDALMEQVEKTNADGTTQGTAEEITKYSDQISNSTSSVLSGIIKLDECLDPAGKTIYVRMGWKPELSEMAADTRANIDNSVARGERGEVHGGSSSSNKVQAKKGYRVKSKYADDF